MKTLEDIRKLVIHKIITPAYVGNIDKLFSTVTIYCEQDIDPALLSIRGSKERDYLEEVACEGIYREMYGFDDNQRQIVDGLVELIFELRHSCGFASQKSRDLHDRIDISIKRLKDIFIN